MHTTLAPLYVTEGRVSYCYIVIPLGRAKKKWLVLRLRHPICFALLWGEDKFHRMPMVLGLMEKKI